MSSKYFARLVSFGNALRKRLCAPLLIRAASLNISACFTLLILSSPQQLQLLDPDSSQNMVLMFLAAMFLYGKA